MLAKAIYTPNNIDFEYSMPCKKCGSQLSYGKGNIVRTLWCPKCEGFEVLSKEETIEILNKHIKEEGQEIKELINLFEVESLFTTLLVTREGALLPVLSGHGFKSFEYVSLTDLISKILTKGSKGTKKCDYLDSDFQRLIKIAGDHYETLRLSLLAKQDFGVFIRLPWVKIKDVAVEFETAALLRGERNLILPNTGFTELFKFNENWVDIMDNLNDSGFISPNEAYDNRKSEIIFDQVIEEHLQAVNIKTSIELAMRDKNIFEQDKFKDNFEYIDLIDKLSYHFWGNLVVSKETITEFECSLAAVDESSFKDIVKTYGFDIATAYDLLVTKIGKNTSFPLIYQLENNKLLIPPLTLGLFRRLLKVLYSKELKDKLSKEGYKFEEKVCNILEKIGLSVNQPNDCTKKLINIKDDYENPTIEIDIIAYDYHTKKLFVIDCKNILFTTDFITRKRENIIRTKFEDQPAKQKKRIEFIRNNLSSFGFSSRKIEKYISVLVTTNKEPINTLDNCHIISIRNINKIKGLEPII